MVPAFLGTQGCSSFSLAPTCAFSNVDLVLLLFCLFALLDSLKSLGNSGNCSKGLCTLEHINSQQLHKVVSILVPIYASPLFSVRSIPVLSGSPGYCRGCGTLQRTVSSHAPRSGALWWGSASGRHWGETLKLEEGTSLSVPCCACSRLAAAPASPQWSRSWWVSSLWSAQL